MWRKETGAPRYLQKPYSKKEKMLILKSLNTFSTGYPKYQLICQLDNYQISKLLLY